MILRILATSLAALGLGFIIEDANAAKTVLCDDGRIIEVAAANGGKAVDPCRRIGNEVPAPAGSVPLPTKRPALTRRKVELKGLTEATPAPRLDGPLQSASTDFRQVRILNARPGAARWYRHTR